MCARGRHGVAHVLPPTAFRFCRSAFARESRKLGTFRTVTRGCNASVMTRRNVQGARLAGPVRDWPYRSAARSEILRVTHHPRRSFVGAGGSTTTPAGAPAPPRIRKADLEATREVLGRHVGRGDDPGDALARPARETRGVRRRPTRKYFTTRCDGPGRPYPPADAPFPPPLPRRSQTNPPRARCFHHRARARRSSRPKPWRPRFPARRASHHDGGRHRRARDRGSRG